MYQAATGIENVMSDLFVIKFQRLSVPLIMTTKEEALRAALAAAAPKVSTAA